MRSGWMARSKCDVWHAGFQTEKGTWAKGLHSDCACPTSCPALHAHVTAAWVICGMCTSALRCRRELVGCSFFCSWQSWILMKFSWMCGELWSWLWLHYCKHLLSFAFMSARCYFALCLCVYSSSHVPVSGSVFFVFASVYCRIIILLVDEHGGSHNLLMVFDVHVMLSLILFCCYLHQICFAFWHVFLKPCAC